MKLAYEHGWRSMGIRAQELTVYASEADGSGIDEATRRHWRNYEDRDGGYFTNDFQIVTANDAANIADALERALDDESDDPELSEFIGFCCADAFSIG